MQKRKVPHSPSGNVKKLRKDAPSVQGQKTPMPASRAAPVKSALVNQSGVRQRSKWASVVPAGMKITRKQLRKEMRQMKKARKHAYFSNKPVPTLALKLKQDHDATVASEEKARRLRIQKEKKRQREAARRENLKQKRLIEEKERKQKEEEEERRKKEDLMDEKEIKKLEKQLSMSKRKSSTLPKIFLAEGLDYILDAVDPEKVKFMQPAGEVWNNELDSEGSNQDGSEQSGSDQDGSEYHTTDSEADPDELDEFMGEGEDKRGDSDNSTADNSENSSSEDLGNDSESRNGSESDDMEPDEMEPDDMEPDDMEPRALDAGESESSKLENNLADVEHLDKRRMKGQLKSAVSREDIYGRPIDIDGKVGGSAVYIPPAKRAEMELADNEARKATLAKLRRRLKGQINRVSDSNIQSISQLIEAMYREASRADLNETLRDLISESVLSDTITPERLSMDTAMLIALLHNSIGTEIGATFLETLANSFSAAHCNVCQGVDDSKKIDNVVALLCHLYSFQVTHSVLIVDILRLLTESFKDKDIELILLILRNVGFALRRDDPSNLKDIILQAQKKANQADTGNFRDPSRVKFMLDILQAVKNNNMRKIPNYDTSHMEHLRKLVRGYLKEGSLGQGQLKISLNDLLESQSKGKWWVVGSAWQGSEHKNETMKVTEDSIVPQFTSQVLELARKQRMNTETRKNIFCTVMTSEDYIDAFERLQRLGLKSQQEREIVSVVVECCCSENSFNFYYSHLLLKFLNHHRCFLFAFQMNLWDRFKNISTQSETAIAHLAKLTGHFIVEKVVSLAVLKTIEFGELNKPMAQYMRQLLERIFEADDSVISEVFSKIGRLPKLKPLREGLSLFMHHFLLRKTKNQKKSTLNAKVDAAERGLTLADTGVMNF